MLAFWAFFGITWLADATQHHEFEAAKALCVAVLCLLFSWWYFFHKPSVIEYLSAQPTSIKEQGSFHVRPIGVTLLATALVWLSFAGFLQAAFFLAGIHLANMTPALVVLATFYSIAGAYAAVGLWRLKIWAPWAFLAWSGCVLAFLLVLGLSRPAELTLGGARGVWLYTLAMATVLFALNRYVRAVYARAA